MNKRHFLQHFDFSRRVRVRRGFLAWCICAGFFLPGAPGFALELTDVYSSLSDAFSWMTDKNAGMTVFPSLYVPAGGRAEAMGTAFTALSDDIGFIEYNPAASCLLENTEVAAFHNAWIADTSVETLAFTRRNGDFGYGVALKCLYVPFSEKNMFGERVSAGYYSETIGTLNFSYNFLSGYNFKGLALGVSLKTAYRSIPDYADNDTNEVISGSGLLQSGVGFMADAGLKMRFNVLKMYASREPNFSVALVLCNFGVALTGLGGTVEVDDPVSSRIAAGIAWQPLRPVAVTLEFRQPVNVQDITLSGLWSAAAGLSVQCTDFFAFQGGFLLSGGNPRFSLGSEFRLRSFLVNVNYTLDLTTSANPVNRISLCAKFDLGDRGRKALQDEVDSLYTEGLRLYTAGYLEEAVAQWNEALRLNPGFDPAKLGIAAAENALLLQQRIREIQVLD